MEYFRNKWDGLTYPIITKDTPKDANLLPYFAKYSDTEVPYTMVGLETAKLTQVLNTGYVAQVTEHIHISEPLMERYLKGNTLYEEEAYFIQSSKLTKVNMSTFSFPDEVIEVTQAVCAIPDELNDRLVVLPLLFEGSIDEQHKKPGMSILEYGDNLKSIASMLEIMHELDPRTILGVRLILTHHPSQKEYLRVVQEEILPYIPLDGVVILN